MRYSLVGVLPNKFITHFQILSSSIYALLQENISHEQISSAESNLNKFADMYEELYGKKNVTMNIHLLRHIANAVRNLGPLWAQSTFGFETNNGILVHSRTAKREYLQQISWKYCMSMTLDKNAKANDPFLSLGKKKRITFDLQDVSTLNEYGFNIIDHSFNVYTDVSIRGTKFTSKNSKQTSTIDHFVRFHDEKIGAIKYFFLSEEETYAFTEIYTVKASEDHLHEIENSNESGIYNVKEIAHKLIYMSIVNRQIITSIPNKFEKT